MSALSFVLLYALLTRNLYRTRASCRTVSRRCQLPYVGQIEAGLALGADPAATVAPLRAERGRCGPDRVPAVPDSERINNCSDPVPA